MAERTETMSGAGAPAEPRRSVDDIERDIQQTQREMSRTIDEIQYRLSPDYIKATMKAKAKVRMRETSKGFMDRVKEHPAAAAMVGLGAWMLFKKSDSERDFSENYVVAHYDELGCGVCGASLEESERGWTERMRDGASSVGDRARDAAGNVRESATHAAHKVSESTSHAAHRVADTSSRVMHNAGERAQSLGRSTRYRAQSMARSTARSYEENPFILGGVGIVLGALLGAAIPETERERAMMGPARDQALDRARELAREKGEQVKHVAQAARDAAVREGKNEARREGLVDDDSANRLTTP
ncbi:MAG TPA: DUF3618 domain-containing protein [Thermoanaerobaculia bacterium]|nr:DUF3618 domain-containing protein [Thermoanaerobaculia bacterium]